MGLMDGIPSVYDMPKDIQPSVLPIAANPNYAVLWLHSDRLISRAELISAHKTKPSSLISRVHQFFILIHKQNRIQAQTGSYIPIL
jgi:hypothetical protein